MNGRKRHILVDTLGLLLAVVVHAANIQESEGAKLVLRRALGRFPRLRHIWVDQGYKPYLAEWAQSVGRWMVEIVPSRRSNAASPCCRDAGWWSGPSRGSGGAGA